MAKKNTQEIKEINASVNETRKPTNLSRKSDSQPIQRLERIPQNSGTPPPAPQESSTTKKDK